MLHLHGDFDACVLPSTAQGSGQYVTGDYEWRVLDGVGHFPHNEVPELVSGELIRWAKLTLMTPPGQPLSPVCRTRADRRPIAVRPAADVRSDLGVGEHEPGVARVERGREHDAQHARPSATSSGPPELPLRTIARME